MATVTDGGRRRIDGEREGRGAREKARKEEELTLVARVPSTAAGVDRDA